MIRLQVLYPHPYPLPLYLVSSSPLLSLLFFLSPTLRGSWCSVGVATASADVSTGACPEGPSPPRQASEYLLACLSVFLSFGLTVRSRSYPFLAPVLSPSPVISTHSRVMMNLISPRERWIGRAPKS